MSVRPAAPPRDIGHRALRDEIVARTDLACLIAEDIPLTRRGAEYKASCPFHREQTPSFHVVPAKGFYHCFGCGAHGDAVSWLIDYRQEDWPAAMALLALRAGLDLPSHLPRPDGVQPRRTKAPRIAVPDPAAEAAARERGLAADAPEARRSLQSRDIRLPPPPTIRLSPALDYWWTPPARSKGERPRPVSLGRYPALICAIQAPDRSVVAVQRIYLAPGGEGKARIPDPKTGEPLAAKKTIGCAGHGALRFGPPPLGGRIDLVEGPETGLRYLQAWGLRSVDPWIPERTVWVTVGKDHLAGGGVGQGRPHPDGLRDRRGRVLRLPSHHPDPQRPGVILPREVVTVGIGEDADSKDRPSVEAIYRRASTRFAMAGFEVRRFRPPAGMDFNDLGQHGPPVAA